jgi:hypothetical protein
VSDSSAPGDQVILAAVHGRAVTDLGARGGGRCRERSRERVHTAFRNVHAVHHVHVRDHGIDRERLVRRESGIERLEAEDAPEALVGEASGDDTRQSAERAESHQLESRTDRADEVER